MPVFVRYADASSEIRNPKNKIQKTKNKKRNPNMLYHPEKVSLLSKVREAAFSLAFFTAALLAMAGWVYWLSSIVWKMVLWCFS